MATQIKLRRDTYQNWFDNNPVLGLAEPGFDTTNKKLKIGDGTTAWRDLAYFDDKETVLSALTQDIVPATDNTYDIGSPSNRWRHGYFANGSLYVGDIKLSNNAGKLEITKVINPGEENEEPDPEDSNAGSSVTNKLVNGAHEFALGSDGSVTLDGSPFSGGGSANIIGDQSTNVEVDTASGNVYIRTYDNLRQHTYEWMFDTDGIMYSDGEGSVVVNGISGPRGNDLSLFPGDQDRFTRLLKFIDADGTEKNTYVVDSLQYQVNDIVSNNIYLWYSPGNTAGVQSIVDNLDSTWTFTFGGPVTLAADTEYTLEWVSNRYNDVNIETNSGSWTFESTGAIQFNDSTRLWTAPGALAQPLPYGLEINTSTTRITSYGAPIAEIDPNVMTSLTLPGNKDDNYVSIGGVDLPFPIHFLNQDYTVIGVGSNSYISFGGTTSNYNFGDDPTMAGARLPAIIISEADNSFQRVLTYTTGSPGSQEFTIRYEGTNATSGTIGQSNIIWQVTFYEATPDIINLLLIQDARGSRGISGITNGSYWQMQDASGRALPRAPWNTFSYRTVTFANSNISIDADSNATVSVGIDGAALPELSVVDGNSWTTTITQPTLELGVNTSNVTIADTPSDVTNRGNRTILIQGQRGYGNYTTAGQGGKGTSIKIIGGLGGESSEANNGGEGGTINIQGGTGQYGAPGGWVNIQGGHASEWNDQSGNPWAGQVNISGGNAFSLPSGKGYGGDVRLQGGQGAAGNGSIRFETYSPNNGWKYFRMTPNGSLQLPNGYAFMGAQNTTVPAGSAPTVVYNSVDSVIGTIKATIKVFARQADDINGDHDEDTQVCEMLIAVKRRFIDNGGTWTNTAVASVYGVTHTSINPLATFTVNFVQNFVEYPGAQPRDAVQILAEPTAAVTGTNMWVMVAATEMTND